MPLLSAIEDFVQRSLAPLPTLWEKLRFVAELREGSDRYRHWGLEQQFGESDAQTAISQAHAEILGEFASTSFSHLWVAADQAARREEVDLAGYLASVRSSHRTLPTELGGVPPEHVQFVLSSLTRVSRSRSMTSPTAA